MNEPQFIVAEVSKNWLRGGHNPEDVALGSSALIPDHQALLCQRFEYVIEVNLARGYRLHSFQLHRLMPAPDRLNETIIAVFERIPG